MNKLQRLDQLARRMTFARNKTETEVDKRKREQAWMIFNDAFMETKEIARGDKSQLPPSKDGGLLHPLGEQ